MLFFVYNYNTIPCGLIDLQAFKIVGITWSHKYDLPKCVGTTLANVTFIFRAT